MEDSIACAFMVGVVLFGLAMHLASTPRTGGHRAPKFLPAPDDVPTTKEPRSCVPPPPARLPPGYRIVEVRSPSGFVTYWLAEE